MTICERTELPEEMCSHCRGLDKPEPVDAALAGPVFEARFEGRCANCHREIEVGDRIARTEDERYAHAGCVGVE